MGEVIVIAIALVLIATEVVWALRDVVRHAIDRQSERYEHREIDQAVQRLEAVEEQVDELHMAQLGRRR